jgi:AcrR family transcriptional regulator
MSAREMNTRERIIEAAAETLRAQGLRGATTKVIARAAGLSEAALYKHFRDKEDLLLCVLREELPPFVRLVTDLPARAGQATVESNLEEVARLALAFYAETVALGSAVFAEPELLNRHREALRAAGAGPHRGIELVAAYLAAEGRLGRLTGDARPEIAAALLLGACFQRAFVRQFLGDVLEGTDEAFAAEVGRTVARWSGG